MPLMIMSIPTMCIQSLGTCIPTVGWKRHTRRVHLILSPSSQILSPSYPILSPSYPVLCPSYLILYPSSPDLGSYRSCLPRGASNCRVVGAPHKYTTGGVRRWSKPLQSAGSDSLGSLSTSNLPSFLLPPLPPLPPPPYPPTIFSPLLPLLPLPSPHLYPQHLPPLPPSLSFTSSSTSTSSPIPFNPFTLPPINFRNPSPFIHLPFHIFRLHPFSLESILSLRIYSYPIIHYSTTISLKSR